MVRRALAPVGRTPGAGRAPLAAGAAPCARSDGPDRRLSESVVRGDAGRVDEALAVSNKEFRQLLEILGQGLVALHVRGQVGHKVVVGIDECAGLGRGIGSIVLVAAGMTADGGCDLCHVVGEGEMVLSHGRLKVLGRESVENVGEFVKCSQGVRNELTGAFDGGSAGAMEPQTQQAKGKHGEDRREAEGAKGGGRVGRGEIEGKRDDEEHGGEAEKDACDPAPEGVFVQAPRGWGTMRWR